MKRPAPRQIALLAALGISLAATAWVAGNDEPETAAPAARRGVASPKAAAPQDWPGPASSTREAWPEADVEARSAWGEAAAPATAVAAAAPAPAPAAEIEGATPPFPFELVGRMTDSRPRVILNGAQRSLVLGVGEVVDGQWRIEAIEAGGLRLKRLPDGPSQFIAFPSS
ncbi:hypothetical protein [Roseateles sp. P5_D6]